MEVRLIANVNKTCENTGKDEDNFLDTYRLSSNEDMKAEMSGG